jgi:hypothetical protein
MHFWGRQKIVEQRYICDDKINFILPKLCQQLTPEARKLLNKKISKKIEEINNAKISQLWQS